MIVPLKNKVKIAPVVEKGLQKEGSLFVLSKEKPFFSGKVLGVGAECDLVRPDGGVVKEGDLVMYEKGRVVELETKRS